MDSYGYIDSIQVEKANALARYKRFNNISKLFRAIEVFIAVALISWSSTRIPAVFRVSGEYIYACSSYVLNQHVVFLVGNVIVVVCYVISRRTEIGNESDEPEVVEDVRFRSRSSDNRKTIESGPVTEPVPVTTPVPAVAPVEEVQDEVFRQENATVIRKTDAETVIKQAVKQIERFRRTQSAKLSREMSTKSTGELRRSVTERRRCGGGDAETTSVETVERLSNEEFRLAIEAFIFKQKQQSM